MLFIVLSYFFFPCTDEIDFVNNIQFSNFKEFIYNIFYFGNGRFLGNAIGVFFSFHLQWFYFIVPFVIAAISLLCEKITNVKYARHYVFAFILFQPIWSFAESIVRLTTFANYYIPIMLSLLCILIVKDIYEKNKKPNVFNSHKKCKI